MRMVQFLLLRDRQVVAQLNAPGADVPRVGDTYLVHARGEEEPALWEVVSPIHRELWPGPSDIVLTRGRPLSVVDPDHYHEGDTVVVLLRPAEGKGVPKP